MSLQTTPIASNQTNNSNASIPPEVKDQKIQVEQLLRQSSPGTANQLNLPPLGKAIYIKGDVVSEQDMAINGKIKGTISVKNNILQIGETARIEGTTVAKVVILSGKLKGDIYASQKVIIQKTGNFLGNIYSPDISIQEGAVLKGNIDMEKNSAFKQPQPETPPVFESQVESKKSLRALFGKSNAPQKKNITIQEEIVQVVKDPIPRQTAVREVSWTNTANRQPVQEKNEVINSINFAEGKSILGSHVTIKGDIIAEEDLIILGTVDGNVCAKNNFVELGPEAHIKAKIFARSIVHAGESNGDIFAREQLHIKPTGHIIGKVFALSIHIDSGGILNGGIDMEKENIEKIFATIKTNINFADNEESLENITNIKPELSIIRNDSKSVNVDNKAKLDIRKSILAKKIV